MGTNRHRTALLTWAVVYPLVTGLLAVLDPFIGSLAMPIRTLVLTAIMVPVMVYLAMPIVTSRLADWMAEAPSKAKCLKR
jgi:antibiotic biosynthesis monooxygenase (ABM) superfamily enzyme